MSTDTYEIIRFYRDSFDRDTVETGLTLEEAKEYCDDPDTEADDGSWFYGFQKE